MIPARGKLPSVGFVTTCRGRLHHLRRTLPLILAQRPDEMIVVDHDCPQGTADWVEANHPAARVLRIRDGAPFHLARARNLGIGQCSSDMLCLIDADVLVKPGFVDWIRRAARRRTFYRHGPDPRGRRDRETWGTMICPRGLILEAGLYDEVYDGWGGEDDDLYYRLRSRSAVEAFFPFPLIDVIHHDDVERFAPYADKDRRARLLVNRLYLDAKKMVLAQCNPRGDLDLALRQRLRTEARRAVFDPEAGGRFRLQVTHHAEMMRSFGLATTLNIDIKVDALAPAQRAARENTDD